jgi:hypothetical protein
LIQGVNERTKILCTEYTGAFDIPSKGRAEYAANVNSIAK